MSRDDAHPALHTPDTKIGTHLHFVPEGWEDFDRGICPCGEVVVWNESGDVWLPDRSMRVLVLTSDEAVAVQDMLALASTEEVAETRDMVGRQILLQDEIEEYERE